jgi:hypothetical protein
LDGKFTPLFLNESQRSSHYNLPGFYNPKDIGRKARNVIARAEAMAPLQQVGNTTYDPNTGLEWLDLSQTAGQSYASVLNGWNGYTTTMGFQFATRSEVIQLFEDAGAAFIGSPPSPSTADLASASLTLSLLGTTLSQSGESRSWMFYNPSTEPTPPSSAYVPSAVFGVGTVYAGFPQEGFFPVPKNHPNSFVIHGSNQRRMFHLLPAGEGRDEGEPNHRANSATSQLQRSAISVELHS